MIKGALQGLKRELSEARILICEDEPINAEVLRAALEGMFHVDVVYSGDDAIAFCSQLSPDLVLMDVLMEGTNGLETCRQLRNMPGQEELPVIFVTSLESSEDEIRCWEAGCVDFVSKPINAITLQNRVKAHVSHKLQTELLMGMTFIDGLTGVYNRNYLNNQLPKYLRKAQRDGESLSLLMLDIDWFKRYNDTYGHLQGDECLRDVADIIVHELHRPGDIVIRFGGEEFLCVLADTDTKGADYVGQRILNAIRDAALVHEGSPHKQVTVSIGGVVVDEIEPNDASQMIERADRALYQAKEAGRNRLVIHQMQPESEKALPGV